MKLLLASLLSLIFTTALASQEVVNVYLWGGLPNSLIQQFEAETGIRVNISTYDTNETLYAKLKSNPSLSYDVIQPSSYFAEKLRQQNMLAPLNHKNLSNYAQLMPVFKNPSYDPHNAYSIPYTWGVTGIFINRKRFPNVHISKWHDLWSSKFRKQVLLINDLREVFAMALLDLGYKLNTSDPQKITQAYALLKLLLPNIKIFSSDSRITLLADGDADIGMAWNGDVFKAQQDNPDLSFIYPAGNLAIWSDNFAIPINALHKQNAYKFINFLLRPESAKIFSTELGYTTSISAARQLLPKKMQQDPVFYPPEEVLKRASFQRHLDSKILELYQKYWQTLKLS